MANRALGSTIPNQIDPVIYETNLAATGEINRRSVRRQSITKYNLLVRAASFPVGVQELRGSVSQVGLEATRKQRKAPI